MPRADKPKEHKRCGVACNSSQLRPSFPCPERCVHRQVRQVPGFARRKDICWSKSKSLITTRLARLVVHAWASERRIGRPGAFPRKSKIGGVQGDAGMLRPYDLYDTSIRKYEYRIGH